MSFDWTTLALQTINVLVLLALLQRYLYRPVIGVIERRQAEIDGRLRDSESDRNKAAAARTAAEGEREAIAAQRQQILDRAREEGEAAKAARLADIEAQGARLIEDARQRIAQERGDTQAELQASAARLAGSYAQRVLQGLDRDVLLQVYLGSIATKIEMLRSDPSPDIRVISATLLAETERKAIAARLALTPGASMRWHYEVDPSLMGGLVLERGDTVVAHTLSQDLARLIAAANELDAAA
ncbi:MAG: F-type H+-transporting ATPase subunit b [Hydrocarboniphaga sp.]|uniref:F0F1 ATP synthase subunit delta n=1 Tax=Hydrocarboniphaga sp. TaxID=2033016 RepID=UPI0026370E41|nr:F0F1 ATP synthase subunit delta [Hydrocarboniphaga sp.]MDB5972266.1 F-type H+-transporting ATPase subunit b [Hydrocarboniphaga sp.]